MNEATTETAPKAKRMKPVPVEAPGAPAKIIKRVPRQTATVKSARERGLRGRYRVIHGKIPIPVPAVERQFADGSIDPTKEPFEYAIQGDILELNDEDAARMIDLDVVEPETVPERLSRMGKVWAPPKPDRV